MRLLAAEDDTKIAGALKKGLEQEMFSVDVVHNGEEAFDLASVEPYDLLILDLMLPKLDGINVCKKLKAQNNPLPILMLTAKGELNDKILGLNSGADDYLTKPFAFEELLARIRALLRRPQNILGTKLTANNLELDTISYDVKRAEQKIELSKREFSLLEFLMRNKNRLVTKEQIIGHVWEYHSDILPNTVEQYIGYLRNKVDRPFTKLKPLIKTVRGFGYKIAEDAEE
ncbi:MAG: DNA-binding response regulator [Candidatus Moranbacteria bacterium CG_4_9_14_3_um_filter_42_9]|nr:MAG: DNA-binding response regulator [Candidatus Moranbacteria bacterium CG_4_9_14_3_um_filter_42_9]